MQQERPKAELDLRARTSSFQKVDMYLNETLIIQALNNSGPESCCLKKKTAEHLSTDVQYE